MQVEFFKKTGSYVDKEGKQRKSLSFYVKCNDKMIPVEPTYYKKKSETGEELRDFDFSNRKSILEAFASELPELENEKKGAKGAKV